jgi:hypothetical protein
VCRGQPFEVRLLDAPQKQGSKSAPRRGRS